MRRSAAALLLVACAGAPPAWHARSPDGARRLRVVETEAGARLLVDGREAGAFLEVAVAHLAWSGRDAVVPVRTARGWHVLRGDALGEAHEAVGEPIADGGSVAYAALDADGWRVVHDGVAGPRHETILAGSLRLESGRLAYVAREASGVHAVVDGLRGPAHRYVDRLGFAGKGAAVVHVAYDEDATIVVDGVEVVRADAVHELVLARESARWAAIVAREGALWLARDGESAPLPRGAHGLVLSPDGARVAWLEPAGSGVGVRVDGTLAGRHAEVRGLDFVPRRLTPLWAARDARGWRVVHDGRAGPRFDEVEGPSTSASGHFGYAGRRRAGTAVIVDGRAVFRGEWASAPELAAASDGWACVVREAGRRYVLGPSGRAEVPAPFVDTLVLDREGAHWALAIADAARRQVRVLVDGADVAPVPMEEIAAAVAAGRDGGEATRALVRSELLARQQELAREVAAQEQ